MFRIKTIYVCETCGKEFDTEKDKTRLHKDFWHHENSHCSSYAREEDKEKNNKTCDCEDCKCISFTPKEIRILKEIADKTGGKDEL